MPEHWLVIIAASTNGMRVRLQQTSGHLPHRPTAMGTLMAALAPGRTDMMIRNLSDADSLPPHLAMGMRTSFVVTSVTPPPARLHVALDRP